MALFVTIEGQEGSGKTTIGKKIVERLIQDGAKEHNLIDHCKLNNDIHFIFDLVEIDDNKNILRLFEIKSIQSIRYNRNYTYRLLNRFKDITQAPIFLVFLDENNVLQIIPHEELLDYLNGINPGNRFPSVTTFESYYKRIAKTCIDNPDLKYFFRGHADYDYLSIPSI